MEQKLPTTFKIPHTLTLCFVGIKKNKLLTNRYTTNPIVAYPKATVTLLLTFLLSLILGVNNLQAQISNAPPNEISPWVNNTTYNNLQATAYSGGLCLGGVSNIQNLIDANLDNTASVTIVVGVGCSSTAAVKDPNNTYPAGTWAGFRIGTSGLLDVIVGLNITISTYLDDSATGESIVIDAGLISANLLANNSSNVGFVATQPFNEVRISFSSEVSLAYTPQIYHASIVAFEQGPDLVCNTTTPMMRPAYPMSISEANSNLGTILSINGSSATENVIDSDPNNFATLDFALGSGSLSIKDELATYDAGTFAGFDIESTSLLSVGLLDATTITTYLDGVLQETVSGTSDGILALNTSILNSGNERSQIGFITSAPFDEVQITGTSLLGSMNLYGLSLKSLCPADPSALVCNTPVMATEPAFPLIVNGENTGISGVGVGDITNLNAVVDGDVNNFATIDMAVGVLGSASLSILDPLGSYPANTFTGFDLETGGLLSLDLLNSVTLTTYLDGVQQQIIDGNSDALLAVDSGLLFGNPGRYQIGFMATQEFDELQITINQPVGLDLGVTNIYGMILQSLCESPITCDVTPLSNPGQPVIINSEGTGASGIAGVGTSLSDVQNVITQDQIDFATVSLGAGVAETVSISVLNPLSEFPGGSQAGFMIRDVNDVLEVGLLDQITISTFNDGVPVESQTSSGLVLLEALGLINIDLSGGLDPTGVQFIGLTTTLPYDEVRIEVGSLASVLNELEVYGAYVNPRTIDGLENNPTIQITSIGGDNIVNSTEAGATVPVNGIAGGDAAEGDAIVVTVNGVDYNTTVQSDLSFTVNVQGSDLTADTSLTVNAEITHVDTASSCTTISEASLVYTLDITAPTVPTVNEHHTSNHLPTLTGTADSVDELTVEVNGVTYTEGDSNLTDNTDGTWTLAIPTGNEIPDGTYNVIATASDIAGNSSIDATTDELLIDPNALTTPTVVAQTTNDTTPVITGTADSADDLTVEANGVTYAEADGNLTDNGDGTWTLQIPSGNEIPDGVYDVVATVSDDTGSTATDATTDELTVDTVVPTVPTVDLLVTNDTTPEITGTADSVDELTVAVNGITYTEGDGNLTDNGDDTWTLVIPSGNEIPEGEYDVLATATDAAGNASVDTTTNELTIDTTAPTVPTVDPLVTNNATPEITGTADSVDELTVAVNGITYTEGDGNLTDNGDGTWTLQIPAGNDIPDGVYDVVATATDAAGNASTDPTNRELTIDTTPPTIPTVNQYTTSDHTPLLTGTADSVDELTVAVNGVTYSEGDGNLTDNNNGTWSLQIPTGNDIPDGVYDVAATATDTAGNTSNDATLDELTIDPNALTTPTVVTQITNDTTPLITGTADSADDLTVEVNGVVYTELDTELTDDGTNGWSLQVPVGSEIPEGVYDVVATVTDATASTSTDVTANELTIDLTPPTEPAVDPLVTMDTTPEITGTADSVDELTVAVNGVTYIEGDGNLTDNGDGTWTLQIPAGNELPDGVYDVDAIATDLAGNSTPDATSQELTIDNSPPTVPTVTPVVTNSPTPEITGTADSADELTVEVNGVVYVEGDGNLTDNGDGTWTLAIPTGNDIPDGIYNVIATATDLAGNTSTDATVDELTIDTVPPTVPTVNPLVTNSPTPEITGTADSADDLTVEVNGVAYTEGDGNLTDNGNDTWTLIVPEANEIPDGTYDVKATATDTLGNSSTDATVDELTIDSAAPTVPTVTPLVTNSSTPEITGTADSADELTVGVNGIVYAEGNGDLIDNGDNTWTLQIPEANEIPIGVYNVVATVVDGVGNISTDETTDELTINPEQPTTPTVDPIATVDPTPTITGTADSKDDLTVELDGNVYTEGDGNLVDNGDNTWELTVPEANELEVGVYDVIATATNEHGETSQDATTDELTIETPPVSDLQITKVADNLNPLVGDVIKFTVTLSNTGGTEFTALDIDEVITSGFTYQRHSASTGTYQPTAGRWSIDMLGANQTATLDLWVQVNPTGNHTNIASIRTTTPNDDNSNNSDEVTIELNCLQVFNEFTPNSDGYNDYFRIECIEQYPNSVLKVFNRYGNKVYEVQGYQNDWTGTANVNGAVNRGKQLPAGVYYYSLVVREIGVDKSGWLYIAK